MVLIQVTLILVPLAVLWKTWKRHCRQQDEALFAAAHGCQPLRAWKSTWPFGLDMLTKALRYSNNEQILKFFVDVVGESGTTFEQNLLGSRGIDTVDPKNIEVLLSTNFQDYGLGLRAPTFHPLLGSGIFTQDGTAWKYSRGLLRPQFSSNRWQNFEQIKLCVQRLLDAIPESGVVDLQPLCFKLTFETTMFLLFGDSVSSSDWVQVAGKESTFSQAFNTAQDYLAHRGRLGPFYWALTSRKFREACKTCHSIVDEAVAKALQASRKGDLKKSTSSKDGGCEDGGSSYVFVEALVQQTQDPMVIRDQCLNVLLAGRDTTGCCLQWTFRLLARHQDVLGRLRSEIQKVCGLGDNASTPSRDDLKQMHYLQNVIKEGISRVQSIESLLVIQTTHVTMSPVLVLRLYPSVPANSREAVRLTVLPTGGGKDGKSPILVRPGEGVGYCVYVMHRRKDIYGEDADEFRPERWEGDDLKNVGWAYIPFNGGPRLCLGQDFALQLVAYTVARLVQVFPQITLPPTERNVKVGDEKQILTLVVSCAEGCVVKLSR